MNYEKSFYFKDNKSTETLPFPPLVPPLCPPIPPPPEPPLP